MRLQVPFPYCLLRAVAQQSLPSVGIALVVQIARFFKAWIPKRPIRRPAVANYWFRRRLSLSFSMGLEPTIATVAAPHDADPVRAQSTAPAVTPGATSGRQVEIGVIPSITSAAGIPGASTRVSSSRGALRRGLRAIAVRPTTLMSTRNDAVRQNTPASRRTGAAPTEGDSYSTTGRTQYPSAGPSLARCQHFSGKRQPDQPKTARRWTSAAFVNL